MLHLANTDLQVDLLDPGVDRAQLGPRFCWGGYIWQVHDRSVGLLLSGPEWPRANPQPHNGQGLPESFRHSTTSGEPLLWNGAIGLAPGGGALARDNQGDIIVTEPCSWKVDVEPERAVFRTAQKVADWSYALERAIELEGRQVRSRSRLTNHGTAPLVLQYFAHPFFALDLNGLVKVTVPTGTQLAENPGYLLSGRDLTLRRSFVGTNNGHLDHLLLPAETPLVATLSHPKLTELRFTTDFVSFKCVVWANANTLSLEPFLALDLAPGESCEWTLTYDFGPAATR
jgi:hypothetical protein